MLSGFTAAFVISALALMAHQTHRTLGIEWLLVSSLAAAINTIGYVQGSRFAGSRYALSPFRIVGGGACYLGQIIGCLIFFLGSTTGIYVAAMALIVNFYFLVSWILAPDRGHGTEFRMKCRRRVKPALAR
jgi:hypothetical protein